MQNILKLIKKSKNVAIFSHKGPDPDAVGSALAFRHALIKMGKNVSLFCDDEIPETYAFLEGFDTYNKDDLGGFDLYISIDVAAGNLLGKYEEEFKKFENTIKIDHHGVGENFAKHCYVKTYSACAIVIYEVLKHLKAKITDKIATCLYLAICGDTGVFRNNNLDSKTFAICSELLDYGADYKLVYSEFFDKKTIAHLYLTSNAIMSAYVDDEYKFTIMAVSSDDYERFGASDNEPIGNLPQAFLNCGYKISVILKQKQDGIHCSFRSKSEYDVAKIAQTFGGGGHKNAAGCLIIDGLSSAERQVTEAVKNYLKENN